MAEDAVPVLGIETIAKLLEIETGKVFVKGGDPAINILNNLATYKLIQRDPQNPDVWQTTDRGAVFIRWLTEVPLPMMKWVDPRSQV